MPRYEDDADDVPIRKSGAKRRMPIWAWLLIGFGALFLICGGVGVVGYFMWGKQSVVSFGKVWEEDEVKAKLSGKGPKDAVALLGTPNSTKDYRRENIVKDKYAATSTDFVYLEYSNRIRNPITGKADTCTLVFQEGHFQRITR